MTTIQELQTQIGRYALPYWRQPGSGRERYLAIPGGPGLNHSLFRPAFERLTGEVIYLDSPGSGLNRSQKATLADADQWVETLSAFLKAREPVTVLAHSAGCHTALTLAEQVPERILGVVCISPVLGGPKSMRACFEARGLNRPSELVEALWVQKRAASLPEYFQDVVPELDTVIMPQSQLQQIDFNLDVFFHEVGTLLQTPLASLYKKVSRPVQFFAGSKDPLNFGVALPEMLALKNTDRLIVMERSGHNIMLSEPEALLRGIERFAHDTRPLFLQ